MVSDFGNAAFFLPLFFGKWINTWQFENKVSALSFLYRAHNNRTQSSLELIFNGFDWLSTARVSCCFVFLAPLPLDFRDRMRTDEVKFEACEEGGESLKERKWNPILCCFISTFNFLLFWHGKRQRKQRCLDGASVCRLTCHKGLMLVLQRQLETPGGPLEGSHWRLPPLPWSLIKGWCLSYNVGVCLCDCVFPGH